MLGGTVAADVVVKAGVVLADLFPDPWPSRYPAIRLRVREELSLALLLEIGGPECSFSFLEKERGCCVSPEETLTMFFLSSSAATILLVESPDADLLSAGLCVF
jgi:hypothetical protein